MRIFIKLYYIPCCTVPMCASACLMHIKFSKFYPNRLFESYRIVTEQCGCMCVCVCVCVCASVHMCSEQQFAYMKRKNSHISFYWMQKNDIKLFRIVHFLCDSIQWKSTYICSEYNVFIPNLK